MAEYQQYARCNTIKNICYAISGVAYVGANAIAIGNPNDDHKTWAIAASLLVGSLVALTTGGAYDIAAVNHMEHTIWLYNREIIRPQPPTPDSI